MKHIFFIHTPITLIVSLAIIKQESIPQQDVLFISNGFEINILNIEIVRLDLLFRGNSQKDKLINNIKYFNKTNAIDSVIDKFIKSDNFYAYIPVLNFEMKVIITHQNCISFNFIEEGVVHYNNIESLNSHTVAYSKDQWRQNISINTKSLITDIYNTLRGYNARLRSIPFSYSCYLNFDNVNFYGINDKVFPFVRNCDKKKIVSLQNLIYEQDFLSLDNSLIWIGDNCVTAYDLNFDVYLKGIQEGFISKINKESNQSVFIKFHRGETNENKSRQLKLFKENDINITVIDDRFVMEMCLLKSQNVTLFGVISSLLFYGTHLGHTSYSIYNRVESGIF